MNRVLKLVLWTLGALLGVLVLLLFVFARWATQLEHEQITEDLHVISTNLGGNVAVLSTGEGAVIVDTMMLAIQGRAIDSLVRELTGEEVLMIINTHWHADHTHGNPVFDPGTRIVSTARTKAWLETRDADYWEGDASVGLPNETFEGSQVVLLGDKTIELHWPGRGHTDGDLVVLFVEDSTIHMGDLYFNHLYPFIDLETGGSVRQWGDSLDFVLQLDFEQVIPGHGPLSGRDGLVKFQSFMVQLAQLGQAAAHAGWTLEETLARAELTEDEGFAAFGFGPFKFLTREFAVERAWEEATSTR